MLNKFRLILGFGLVTCIVFLLCVSVLFTDSKQINKSENLFDMSIEELMQIKVTSAVSKKESNA
ncbi:MAG: hypothetical protein JXA96_15575 [Sedimentisphaerales bacterium]|nr:hypothetical protein [Sedimentisphaerales bacterium]